MASTFLPRRLRQSSLPSPPPFISPPDDPLAVPPPPPPVAAPGPTSDEPSSSLSTLKKGRRLSTLIRSIRPKLSTTFALRTGTDARPASSLLSSRPPLSPSADSTPRSPSSAASHSSRRTVTAPVDPLYHHPAALSPEQLDAWSPRDVGFASSSTPSSPTTASSPVHTAPPSPLARPPSPHASLALMTTPEPPSASPTLVSSSPPPLPSGPTCSSPDDHLGTFDRYDVVPAPRDTPVLVTPPSTASNRPSRASASTPSPERRRKERERDISRERDERLSMEAAGGRYRVEPVALVPVTDAPSNPPTRVSSVRRPGSPGASAALSPSNPSHTPSAGISAASPSSSKQHGSSATKQRQQRVVGDYFLGKTLGAGSMGKVKLGSHVKTGAKVAIKIIPRTPPDAHRYLAQQAHAQHVAKYPSGFRSDGSPATPPPPLPTDSFVAKSIAKEQSKEVRTIREAAIMMLLHHPYICGMKDMVVHTNHYYMMFELVSGGQMLDYIISHGRLRERAARKFARQIGSALEYCHRNSIVHRDLKIENILISSTGNIKIIDFGLSNLFSPFTQLSTFCGSLYFAAPELLNAKVYTGPEVDVWSFGIVLYVLVCGKVPFDDQSMPALHAKIKRGLVEYPPWLSIECKQILQRMLVTNPAYRAPLSEVMAHPWMTKGFEGAPDAHLVPREPLRLDELDRKVIEGMTGFEFGSADDVERRLRDVLESESYKAALSAWEAKKAGVRGGPEGWRHHPNSSTSLGAHSPAGPGSDRSTSFDAGSVNGSSVASPSSKKSKRSSGFDFFKKKLFSSSPREERTQSQTFNGLNGTGGGAHVNGVTGIGAHPFGEAVKEELDPTRGFHPLISIYYLVREKMERERVYGPGHFASSDMSLPTSADIYAQQPPSSMTNGASSVAAPVSSVGPAPPSRTARAASTGPAVPDYSMPLPRLPAPASSIAPPSSRQPSIDIPSRAGPVPRTRATMDAPGLGDPSVVMQHPSADDGTTKLVPSAPGTPTTPNMPRAPSAATHRRSQSLSQPQSMPTGRTSAEPPRESSAHSSAYYQPSRPQSIHADRPQAQDVLSQPTLPPTAEDDEAAAAVSPTEEATSVAPVAIPTSSSPDASAHGSSLARRFGSILSRSPEDSMGKPRSSKRQSMTLPRSFSRGSGALDNLAKDLSADLPEGDATDAFGAPLSKSAPLSGAVTAHKRAATVLESGPSAKKHDRRTSIGSGVSRSATVTTGMRRASGHQSRPSTVVGDPSDWSYKSPPVTSPTEEETPEQVAHRNSSRTPDASRLDVEDTKDDFKPIYLKGLFSVATTSTRSASALSADIQTVLKNMGIQFRPIRGGFECAHTPSIDLSSIQPSTGNGSSSLKKRPTVKRKTSKLSIGIGKKDKTEGSEHMSPPQRPIDNSQSPSSFSLSRPSSPNLPLSPPVSPAKQSAYRVPQQADSTQHDSATDDEADVWGTSPVRASVDGNMSDMVVRFEVMVIKVPWLPLHGVQFRRVGGNAWQYSMLAKRILTELKL